MKKLLYILAIAVMFTSCPATPPSITPSGLDPHRAPNMPENVQVVSGLKDKIIVSWDAVDNADSYRVFYVDAGNPSGKEMVLTPNAVTNTRVSVDLSANNSPDLSSGNSYYFYVTAYRSLDGEQFVSSPSNYVEGAIAPHSEDIFYHGYITGTRINLYWNCSTLFSMDNPDDMLYDASFSLAYRVQGDNSWTAIESSEEHGEGNPWLNEILNLNRWPQDTILEFQITATVTASDGIQTEVTSNTLEVLVSNDMSPSPVTNVTYTAGDSVDGITLSWTIPEWTGGLDPDGANSYFRIERAEKDSGEFEVIVDEISTSTHDERITREAENKCAFTDTSAEVGKRYVYRIVNAAEKDGLVYVQSDEEYYVTGDAYLFDNPEVTESKAVVTKENTASAKIDFSWNYNNKENLIWKIERTITHPDSNVDPTVSYIDTSIDEATANTAEATFTENLTCTTCEESAHKYSYRLCLVRDDDTLYWRSSEDFTLTTTPEDGATITDNKLELKTEPIIENPSIKERIGKIELKWNLIETESPISDISYTYVLDDGEETLISDVITNEDGTYSYIIEIGDVEEHNISLIAEADGGYRNVLTYVGNALGFNSELFMMATNSDDKENTINVIVKNLNIEYPEREVFTIEYKERSASDWTGSNITVSSENENYEISGLDFSKDYVFRLALSDSTYTDDAPAYSAEVNYMKVTNVSASKGEIGQISVSWNAAVGVDGYNFYRYQEGHESEIKQVAYVDANTYTDTEVELGAKYYYSVKPVYKEALGGSSFNPSASSVNQFGKTEAGNLGYVYSNIIDFTVEESFASDTKLNPYFAIKFKMDEINNVYTIVASNDKTGITIKLDELTNRDSSVWTNGLAENEVGYKVLNTETLEATVNADIGVIDNFDTYAVLSFTMTAMKDDGSVYKTEANTLNEAHYKALGVYDYLYIVNTALSEQLTAADSQFGNDWFASEVWYTSQKYPDDNRVSGIVISNVYRNDMFSGKLDGTIVLSGYKYSGFSLDSGTISLTSTGSTYLGIQDLSQIGNSSGYTTANISVEKTNTIGDKTISYDNASISYNDVYVDGSAGSYTVKIGSDSVGTEILQRSENTEGYDPKVIKRIMLNEEG